MRLLLIRIKNCIFVLEKSCLISNKLMYYVEVRIIAKSLLPLR